MTITSVFNGFNYGIFKVSRVRRIRTDTLSTRREKRKRIQKKGERKVTTSSRRIVRWKKLREK